MQDTNHTMHEGQNWGVRGKDEEGRERAFADRDPKYNGRPNNVFVVAAIDLNESILQFQVDFRAGQLWLSTNR